MEKQDRKTLMSCFFQPKDKKSYSEYYSCEQLFY